MRHFVIVLAACGLLVACKPSNPFASAPVDSIEWGEDQAPARIRLSDPQVFSRESLINDRLEEREFLRDELEKSETVEFGSQIKRDLLATAALSARLGVAFDPSVALQFERDQEVLDLSSKIERTKLQTELLELRRNLDKLRADEDADVEVPESEADGDQPDVVQTADFKALRERLNELIGALDTTLGTIETEAGKGRDVATEASPEQQFEDRRAFRTRIRAAIAATELDDAHDLEGNGLYRFQFRATVLPEPQSKQFGAAVVAIEPPHLTRDDVDALFWTWLAHSTASMNRVTGGDSPEVRSDLRYERLGAATGLFAVAHPDKNGQPFRIAVYPLEFVPEFEGHFEPKRWDQLRAFEQFLEKLHISGFDEVIRDTFLPQNNCDLKNLDRKIEKLRDWGDNDGVINELFKDRYTDRGITVGQINVWDVLDDARWLMQMQPAFHANVGVLVQRSDIPRPIAQASEGYFRRYNEVLSAAHHVFRLLWEQADKAGRADDCRDSLDPDHYLDEAKRAPKAFCEAVLSDDSKSKCDAWYAYTNASGDHNNRGDNDDGGADPTAAGRAYAYLAEPTAQAQRISTVASAANALELALSAKATLPQVGTGIEGGVDSAKRAAARVDAIERVPRVVGFADRRWDGSEGSHFGWVFGPRMMLDPEGTKLELRHDLVSHRVTADLSLPSWWPRVTFKARSAWIGNWQGAGGYIKGAGECKQETDDKTEWVCQEETIAVRLPQTPASLDTLSLRLTNRLMRLPFEVLRLDRVVPQRLAACADKPVTLLVHGTDLWRRPQVVLAGQRIAGDAIKVLPDMSGLSVTVRPLELPLENLAGEATELRVVTSRGTAAHELEVLPCDEEEAALSVEPVTHHLIGADEHQVKLRVVGGLRPSHLPLRLAVRLREYNDGHGKWIVSQDVKHASGEPAVLQAAVKLTTNDGYTDGRNGVLLDAAVLTAYDESAALQPWPGRAPIVFYGKPEHAKVKVAVQPPELTELGEIELRFPMSVRHAFPDLTRDTPIMGTVDGFGTPVTGELLATPTSEGTVAANLRWTDAGFPNTGTYDELRKQDRTLTLAFEAPEGATTPEFGQTIKLKKADQ